MRNDRDVVLRGALEPGETLWRHGNISFVFPPGRTDLQEGESKRNAEAQVIHQFRYYEQGDGGDTRQHFELR